jgi:glycosyltransferase involved in cell wall biosynthesis
MKILYVNTNPRNRISDPAGYATHMAKSIKGFRTAGHEVVTLFASEERAADQARTAYRGMRNKLPPGVAVLLRDAFEIVHDRRFWRGHLQEALRASPDFIYERANAFHLSGLSLSRKLGVPLVLEVNDPLRDSVSMSFSALKGIAFRREDHLMRSADLVILGSQALRSHYIEKGFPPERMTVIYPTADEELFSPARDGARYREKLGLGRSVVVGFVGSMASWHRVDLLLEALELPVLANDGVRGLLVGDINPGKRQASASQKAAGGGTVIAGRVSYEEVPEAIAAMDVCVIANATWYGSPTKLFEYGSMGKAIIAPRFPPIQEVLDDGHTGMLFDPGSAEDLGAKIHDLAAHPEKRALLGRNIQELIHGRYSWARNTASVTERVEAMKVGRS